MNTLNTFADNIYVISLRSRQDRRNVIRKLSEIFGFQYEIFDAIDGKKEISQEFTYEGKKIGDPYGTWDYFRAQVGCLLSHLTVIKKAKAIGYDRIVIFEDDVNFRDDFNERFDKFITEVDPCWDMLWLSGSRPQIEKQFEYYAKISGILTTHSYIINQDSYDEAIDHLTRCVFTKEVDMTYCDFITAHNVYVPTPFLTYQSEGYSDVQEKHCAYGSIIKHM